MLCCLQAVHTLAPLLSLSHPAGRIVTFNSGPSKPPVKQARQPKQRGSRRWRPSVKWPPRQLKRTLDKESKGESDNNNNDRDRHKGGNDAEGEDTDTPAGGEGYENGGLGDEEGGRRKSQYDPQRAFLRTEGYPANMPLPIPHLQRPPHLPHHLAPPALPKLAPRAATAPATPRHLDALAVAISRGGGGGAGAGAASGLERVDALLAQSLGGGDGSVTRGGLEALIADLGRQGHADEALRVFQWMQTIPGMEPGERSHCALIGALRSARRVEEAMRLYCDCRRAFGRRGLRPATHRAALLTLTESGLFREAHALLASFSGSSSGGSSTSSSIGSTSPKVDEKGGVGGPPVVGVPSSSSSSSSNVSSSSSSGVAMEPSIYVPLVVLYIEAASKARQLDGLPELLQTVLPHTEEAPEQGQRQEEEQRQARGGEQGQAQGHGQGKGDKGKAEAGGKGRPAISAFDYSRLVAACSRAGLLEQVRGLAWGMTAAGLQRDVVVWTAVIRALLAAEQPQEACLAVWDMQQAGCACDLRAYEACMAAYCKVEDLAKAEKLVRQMHDSQCPPSVAIWNQLIGLRVRKGQLAEARGALREMQRSCKPNAESYNLVIRGYKEGGNLKEALRVATSMPDGHLLLPHDEDAPARDSRAGSAALRLESSSNWSGSLLDSAGQGGLLTKLPAAAHCSPDAETRRLVEELRRLLG